MNHVDSNNICPVCGYEGLEDGTASGEICSSCGTEFGYSDFQRTHEELRRRWIGESYAQWWSRYTPKPTNWSPIAQLRNIGYECLTTDKLNMLRGKPVVMTGTIVGGKMRVVITTGQSTPTVIIKQLQPKYLSIPKMKARSESYQSSGSVSLANY